MYCLAVPFAARTVYSPFTAEPAFAKEEDTASTHHATMSSIAAALIAYTWHTSGGDMRSSLCSRPDAVPHMCALRGSTRKRQRAQAYNTASVHLRARQTVVAYLATQKVCTYHDAHWRMDQPS